MSLAKVSCCAVLAVTLLAALTGAKRPPNPKLFTGEKCTLNEKCNGTNVFCNELKTCECEFGYSPQNFQVLTLCTRFECKSNDARCADLYGPNTACDAFTQCSCQRSFKYMPGDRECQTNATKLGAACIEPAQCGDSATCDEKKTCQCTVGNVKVNDYACDTYSCTDTAQCEQITANSTCHRFGPSGLCQCEGYFWPSPDRTRCVRKAADRGASCNRLLDCGIGATCVSGRCVCLQGYIPSKENTMDCTAIKCKNDRDCSQYDENSVCDDSREACLCKDKYYSTSDQTCQPILKNITWVYIFIIACVVGGCLVLFLGLRIMARRRQQQQQRSGAYY